MTIANLDTIPAQIMARTNASPNAPAIIFSDQTFSYSQLRDLASAFAINFQKAGVDPTSTLRIKSNDLAVVLPAAIATAILGARLVVGTPDQLPNVSITHTIVNSPFLSDTAVILVDGSYSPALFSTEMKADVWPSAGRINQNDIWMITALTGRSYKTDPNVGLSQSALVERSNAIENVQSGETKFASLWAADSYWFLSDALSVLMKGGAIVEQGPWSFWVESGVDIVSGPAFTIGHEETQQLPVFKASAGWMSKANIIGLLGSFEKVQITVVCPEIGNIFSTEYYLGADNELVESSLGYGHKIEIVTASGNPGPLGTANLMRVQSLGGIPLESACSDGWLYPGLIAVAHEDGEITVLGVASDDVISIDGNQILAALLDSTLESCDGILEAVAFASPKPGSKEVIAFIVFEEGINRYQATAHATKACQNSFGLAFAPAKFRPISQIPRKPDGLVDREACAKLILNASA